MTNTPIIPPVAPAQPGVGGPMVLPGLPSPFVPQPTRFRLKYGVMECMVCGLAKDYCKGHAPSPPTQGDGDGSDLEARVRAVRGAR